MGGQGYANQMSLLDLNTGQVIIPPQEPTHTNTAFAWDPTGQYILVQRFDLAGQRAARGLWIYEMQTGYFYQLVEDGLRAKWIP